MDPERQALRQKMISINNVSQLLCFKDYKSTKKLCSLYRSSFNRNETKLVSVSNSVSRMITVSAKRCDCCFSDESSSAKQSSTL